MTEPVLLASIGEDPLLPMPSPIALQVCAQVNRPDCSIAEVTALIQQDPALGGKILQTVNSALFSLPQPLRALDRALHLLGLRPIRSLVLSLSLPSLTGRSMNEAARQEFWTSAVAGGIVARELAVKMRRGDPEDDLVAGLLRDVGKLILQRIDAATYNRVLAHPPEVLAANQSWVEEQLLGTTHADVSALLLQRWGLPHDITEAVRYHHQPEQAPVVGRLSQAVLPPDGLGKPSYDSLAVRERAQLVYFASLVARLPLPACPPSLARSTVKMARDRFGMNEQELGDFLESLTPKINALADLLQVKLLRTDHLSLLLARSLEQLVPKTRVGNRDAPPAEELQPTTEHDGVQLRRTIMRLRRQTLRDPLTETYSREFLEEALAIEWERAARKSTALGFILIRLDQPLGDQVLKLVAGKLRQQLRAGDIIGRQGEDSFGVIVDNTSEAGLKSLADRLWQALGALSFRRENAVVTLALSVSAAICQPGSTEQTPASLVVAAESTLIAPRTDRQASPILVSLLSDKEAFLIEEVRRCLFSVFLLETGKVTESQVREAVRWLSGPVVSLGRIARKLGWLTPRQWSRLLAAQRQSEKSVATRAVAQGYLIQDQLHWLLAIQRERPEDLADHLVDLGALTEDEAREYLQAYYQMVSKKRGPDHLPGSSNRRSLGSREIYPLPLPPR